jgi:hypothetical protein
MPKSRPRSHTSSTIREIVRRLDWLENRLKRAGAVGPPNSSRRFDIIEAERLRRKVARDTDFRNEHPGLWRRLDRERLERNRETAALNRRLRSEGFRPIALEPSLAQHARKLQRLDAREKAGTATSLRRS